jgi:hypothetical protein
MPVQGLGRRASQASPDKNMGSHEEKVLLTASLTKRPAKIVVSIAGHPLVIDGGIVDGRGTESEKAFLHWWSVIQLLQLWIIITCFINKSISTIIATFVSS